MSREFIYSDPHFGHSNLLVFSSRPFKTAEEMTTKLIKNWNKVVSKNDTVYLLGDIAFRLNKEEVKSIIGRLNGKKILILGNHDRGKTITWWLNVGFHTVSQYPIIYKGRFILSHEPMILNNTLPYINIHGHMHEDMIDSDLHINVSVENTDYSPVLLSDITDNYPYVETRIGIEERHERIRETGRTV